MYYSTETKKKLQICALLIAFSVTSLMLGQTLTNSLLVAHYPTKVLPYFYFMQACVQILATYVTTYYQTQYPIKFALVFEGIVIVSLIVGSIVVQMHLNSIPFIISVFVLTFTAFTTTIAWNIASDIFDIQEYKQLSKWLQASGTLGVTLVGSLVSIYSKAASEPILLASMSLFEFLSVLCIFALIKYIPDLPSPKKQEKVTGSLLNKIPLYRHLVLFIVIGYIALVLVDYSLKIGLAHSVSKTHIAQTVSLLFVISSIIRLFIQIFLFDQLLEKAGAKKILLIFPLGLLLAAAISLIFPTFVIVCALFTICDILYFSVFSLARNLYLNILPTLLKNLARLKLGGIIKPISFGIASFWSLLLSFIGGVRPSLALIIIACGSMIGLSRMLMKEYSEQLMSSIQTRRFNPQLIELKHEDSHEIEAMFEKSLTSDSVDTILFTLNVLENDLSQPLPKCMDTLLESKNVLVLAHAVKLLGLHPKESALVAKAMQTFKDSDNDEIRWYLALYLLENGEFLIPFADTFKKSRSLILLATSCLIYLRQGDLEEQILAMKLLIKMLNAKETEPKIYFLKVLQEISGVRKEGYLIKFIKEEDPILQNLALKQVGTKMSQALLETLVNHLGVPAIAIFLNNILIALGESVLGLLEQKFKKTDSYQIRAAALYVMSHIESEKAEASLIAIFQEAGFHALLITNIAKYLAYRGVKQKIGEPMKAFLTERIAKEAGFYEQIYGLAKWGKNPIVLREIQSRIYFIKKRLLYYIITLTGSIELFGCISPLLSTNTSKNQQAIALELIDSKIENRSFSAIMLAVFTDKPLALAKVPTKIADPWLRMFIDKVKRNDMTSFYKLVQLRKTKLFKNLAAEALQAVAECCISKDMSKGEIIIQEGDEGDGLYVIDAGSVEVTKEGKLLATLSEGAYFGELALLADTPRFATVTAATEGSLFYIDKRDFDTFTDEMPEIMKSITTQIIHYLVVK